MANIATIHSFSTTTFNFLNFKDDNSNMLGSAVLAVCYMVVKLRKIFYKH